MNGEVLCEACRRRPAVVQVDDDDTNQPYQVCADCARRLRLRSLRPLEWFNLAAMHGPTKYLLHDDLYWDGGVSQQPDEQVEEPEKYPAPTLGDVRPDRERLLDYAMTLYILDADTVDALARHDPQSLLASLRRRVDEAYGNPDVEARAYEICQKVLGPVAEEWVRMRWAEVRPETFLALAGAMAACLPFEEGFGCVTRVLEDEQSRAALQQDSWRGSLLGFALSPFRSRRTLDWMETYPVLVTHENWGRVAALSHFSWPRAVDWLDRGRPLSHIALFALRSCLNYDTVTLREQQPRLEETESVVAMVKRLNAYYEDDHVPRVQRLVESIHTGLQNEAHAELITRLDS